MRPILFPIPVEIGSSQIKDGLRSVFGPAHAGALHSVFEQMATRPFGHARADGIAVGDIFVIVHMGSVVVKMGDDAVQRFLLGAFQRVFGTHLLEPTDDILECCDLAIRFMS